MKKNPCPFCGATEGFGVGYSTRDKEGIPAWIYCGKCGAQGPWMYVSDFGILHNIREACEKTGWNKRTEDKK